MSQNEIVAVEVTQPDAFEDHAIVASSHNDIPVASANVIIHQIAEPVDGLEIAEIELVMAVAGGFEVSGWAFKDGVGLRGVEVMLDGRVVAQARYGETNPGVTGYWKDSNDRNHPNVYFRARVEGARRVGLGRGSVVTSGPPLRLRFP